MDNIDRTKHYYRICYSYSTFSTKGIVEVKSSDPPFKNLTHFKIKKRYLTHRYSKRSKDYSGAERKFVFQRIEVYHPTESLDQFFVILDIFIFLLKFKKRKRVFVSNSYFASNNHQCHLPLKTN